MSKVLFEWGVLQYESINNPYIPLPISIQGNGSKWLRLVWEFIGKIQRGDTADVKENYMWN
jgi:hypothetical protein